MDYHKQWSEARTRIPVGEYHVRCVDARQDPIWLEGAGGWGRIEKHERVILWFEVVEGLYQGKVVPMFLNITDPNKIPDGSRYYDAWRIASGGDRPQRPRFKEMNPSKFVNKSFTAVIADVKPTWRIPTAEGKTILKEKPEGFRYSKVHVLYELVTGDPKK